MKYIYTLLLISFSFATTAQIHLDEERYFRFGAKAGVSMNKITGQSYESGFSTDFMVGGFLQFNPTSRIGLQPELNYVQSESTFKKATTVLGKDFLVDPNQRAAKLSYIEIPLLINVGIDNNNVIKLQAGPSMSFVISENVGMNKEDGTTNLYTKGQWSAIGGIMIQLPLIHFGARYRAGLSDINAYEATETWKHQSFQFYTGITL